MWLSISGLLGLLSVALGAYGDHGLKSNVPESTYQSFTTAVKYHQIYSVILLMLGITMLLPIANNLKNSLNISAILFLSGVLLFSFSIYLSILFRINLKFLAPYGGTLLMIAWASVIYVGIKSSVK